MNRIRSNRKRAELMSHRITQYDKALEGVINGKLPPEYMAKRWKKVKPLITKSKVHRK